MKKKYLEKDISPELRQEIIDDLKLKQYIIYNNGISKHYKLISQYTKRAI